MLRNFALYVFGGIFFNGIFTWTGTGLARCAILTAFLQGIDMFRIHHDTVKLICMQPPHIQEEQMATFKKGMPVKFPQHYIAKVIGYSLVTLVAASITRSIMG